MPRKFDLQELAGLGWRQGAILGTRLSRLAWGHAPERVSESANDHLVVTSHDCDVLNASIEKEPVVEVLRARVPDDDRGVDGSSLRGETPVRYGSPPCRCKDTTSRSIWSFTTDGRFHASFWWRKDQPTFFLMQSGAS